MGLSWQRKFTLVNVVLFRLFSLVQFLGNSHIVIVCVSINSLNCNPPYPAPPKKGLSPSFLAESFIKLANIYTKSILVQD